MKRAALGLLCLFILVPVAAWADSLDSATPYCSRLTNCPTAFTQYDFEQFVALKGTGNLLGGFDTKVDISGPAGSFTQDVSSASAVDGDNGQLLVTLLVALPDDILVVTGHYSVMVRAIDDDAGTTRTFGPVYFDVVPQPVVPQPPLLSYPEIVVGEADSATGGHATFQVASFSFVDPTPPPVNCDHPSGSFFPLGSTTVTCTTTDSFGSAVASFPVEISDTVAPIVNVPANFISTTPLVTYVVTATDAVDGSIPVTCSPTSGSTFAAGTTTISCQATDSHANTGFGSFRVTVTGGVGAPVITVPNDIVAEAAGAAGAAVTFTATATNNASIACSPASGSTFAIGTTNVSCTATSPGGSSSDTFNVNVVDTRPPVLSLPATIQVGATGPTGAVVTYTATATDLVDGSMVAGCDHPSGSEFPIGATMVACSATDLHLNTASGGFLVVVTEDATPPVLSLPANITAEATSASGRAVTYTATATDNLDGPVPVVCSPASGTTFAIATTTVQCHATDAHNNTANGSFTITVRDTTPPVVTVAANITKEATSAAGAVATFAAPTATDLVDGSVAASCNRASGSTFPIGVTTVQCTAPDAHNNTGTASFTVNVRDTTPPVLTLPANITKEATSPSGAVVTFTATSTDIVDGARPVTCVPSSGSTFPLGTTTVQCTATDTHNNTAHGSFTVVVRDTTPPHIVRIDPTPNPLWPPDHRMVNVSLSVIAVDAADPAPMSHIVSVTSSQPVNGFLDDNTSPDWIITGALTVQLRAERLDPIPCLIAIILPGVLCDRIYTITVATTDASGNTTNGTTTVTVANPRAHAVH
ncbi:MAG TPA: HYR domain-containing protein [Thermoanaerobaculia bacterium]|jgi:hypothetical protein|nr:HYR domain-containing protein [Thermoanaerobaculia bacterium]